MVDLGITSLFSPFGGTGPLRLLAARYPYIPDRAYLTNIVTRGGHYALILDFQLAGFYEVFGDRQWVNFNVGFPKGIPISEPDHP